MLPESEVLVVPVHRRLLEVENRHGLLLTPCAVRLNIQFNIQINFVSQNVYANKLIFAYLNDKK